MPPPSAYTWAQQNKVIACMSVFFLSNTIEGALLQTGAFEVELNGVPIWSKLQSGRIPKPDELFATINDQLNLSTGRSSSIPSQQNTPGYDQHHASQKNTPGYDQNRVTPPQSIPKNELNDEEHETDQAPLGSKKDFDEIDNEFASKNDEL